MVRTVKAMNARTTDELTPRDLVTQRSGLPRHDLTLEGESVEFKDREVVVYTPDGVSVFTKK
jgi:hypothetical protein